MVFGVAVWSHSFYPVFGLGLGTYSVCGLIACLASCGLTTVQSSLESCGPTSQEWSDYTVSYL